MTDIIRWIVVAGLAVHGLIHLLGAVKGFGWNEVAQLSAPVGPTAGVLWLVAALLVLAAAGLLAAGAPTWWWAVALTGVLASQMAIATAWSDAKAGTAVNVLLLLAAGYAFAAAGPGSFHAQWSQQATRALAEAGPTPSLLTESALRGLPEPVAAYVRRSGAVGRPRVTNFSATFHGRIRGGPTQAWMPFHGTQVNTYWPRPQRVFIMDATKSGLPVTALHLFAASTATMRVKLLSLVTVVDAAGPEMNRGETVTVFNDLVVFAPGAIIGAPIRWTLLDAQHVRGVFTDNDQSVSAVLTFNPQHDLVNFTSQDRSRASSDGKSFTRQGWSTPLSEHRDVRGRRVLAAGESRWHAPPPEGEFTYVELAVDDIAYNVHSVGSGYESGLRTLTGTSP
ncbi:DUF6544 family protein [Luteipulveratus mongoliensis]|uniref:Uncharacterized protein n=1 Tax=Luteipulveratus mongoliensis TaxID=571913 RepID=A0A0K1JFH3_9MICO|nr:DUF6544 family protein [Luteipulveratus mongoliensis]AKU15472.1 hypothetical protein VV02_05655 [Luteipulveratus mongoliensis]